MTINIKILVTIVLALFTVACDEITQQPNSVTQDGQNLSYDYFINNGVGGTHVNISQLLASKCAQSACHGVGGGNGGTFKIYSPADTDAKNISNFISAQGQVIKGANDPTAVTNDYPLAHTSPILKKPLTEAGGGIFHEGDKIGDIFTDSSESTIFLGGNEYGEIYRWIAYTP